MSRTQLSSSEIQDLINKYSSEEKKLEYQIAEVRATIDELSGLLQNVVGREQSALSVVKRRPKKSVLAKVSSVTAAKTQGTKKRGRPKGSVSKTVAAKAKSKSASKKISKGTSAVPKKGYKLSQWDELVIGSIKDTDKVVITQEIIDYVKSKMNAGGKPVSENEVKNKVTRSLQKLANRRGDLKKVSYKGKGYAYALPEWLDAKGKLDKQHKK